jgi:tRNA(adenine34) deaminase
MDDSDFMKEALKEAEIALKEGNWPIGCVIVLDGRIIARAHNQVYSNKDKLAHAEMLALKQAQDILGKNHKKATLYTTYEPCPMCFGASVLSRIKRVVSGIDLDNSGSMYFRENLPLLFKQDKFSVEFASEVLADECYKIFMAGEPTNKLIKEGLIRKNDYLKKLNL